MNNNPFISIIMPVYNNEKLLINAVNSIISQTFEDWELIIIDDGSTDNTPTVVDNLGVKDTRIRVIHQKNQWIYPSYNNGISLANGKYLLIVNSDDTINSESLQKIYDISEKCDADIVLFNLTIISCDENQNIIVDDLYHYRNLLKNDFAYTHFDDIKKNWIDLYKLRLLSHQCVYKTKLAKKLKYRTDIIGADILYNIKFAEMIKTAAGTAYPIYNYYIYNSGELNASFGKYYGYEHEMFNEYYLGYRHLFEKWGVFDKKAADYLASARLNNLTNEIRSFLSPNCPLNVDEKIKNIISGASDDIVYKNAVETDRLEEWESRILSGLRELFCMEIPTENSAYYFMYEMLVSLLRYEKTEYDRQIIQKAISNFNNPMKIGKCFYEKIKWDS